MEAKSGYLVRSLEIDVYIMTHLPRWNKSHLAKQERECCKKFFTVFPFFHSVWGSRSLSSPALCPAYGVIVTKLPVASLMATLLTAFGQLTHFSDIFSLSDLFTKPVSYNSTSFGSARHPRSFKAFLSRNPALHICTFSPKQVLYVAGCTSFAQDSEKSLSLLTKEKNNK